METKHLTNLNNNSKKKKLLDVFVDSDQRILSHSSHHLSSVTQLESIQRMLLEVLRKVQNKKQNCGFFFFFFWELLYHRGLLKKKKRKEIKQARSNCRLYFSIIQMILSQTMCLCASFFPVSHFWKTNLLKNSVIFSQKCHC